MVAPVVAPQHNVSRLAEREVWLPPGQWFDLVAGTEAGISSPAAAAATGVTARLSYTLWEVPVFARGGLMLPTAPPPGVGASGFGAEPAGKQGAASHPTLGGAAAEPSLLCWEVYGVGGTAAGGGAVWEDSIGSTNASYTLEGGGKTLRVQVGGRAPGGGGKRRHLFTLISLAVLASTVTSPKTCPVLC